MTIYESPCLCLLCGQQFRRACLQDQPKYQYSSTLSDDDARQITTTLVHDQGKDRAYLQESCNHHGNRIMNKWKKASRQKREEWLLSADKDISVRPWSYFYQKFPGSSPEQLHEPRAARLLPYIALKTLKMNPSRLLGLLHGRSSHPPEQWASFDNKQLITPWRDGLMALDFNSKCVTMVGPNYGQLTAWEEVASHENIIIGFPRGRLVLEAQQRLLKFLRRIVEILLESVDSASLIASDRWTQQAACGFTKVATAELWSLANQPFSTPPMFDIDQIISVVRLHQGAAEDHLWLLQTDFRYLQWNIRALRDDLGGREQSKTLWTVLAWDIVGNFWDLKAWEELLVQCQKVKAHSAENAARMMSSNVLLPSYDEALELLRRLLLGSRRRQSFQLASVLQRHAHFNHLWNKERAVQNVPRGEEGSRLRCGRGEELIIGNRDASVPLVDWLYCDPCESVSEMTRKPSIKMEDLLKKNAVEWFMLNLVARISDIGTCFEDDSETLFAFLEDHLTHKGATTTDRARLDERLFQRLSDLVTTINLLEKVQLQRPKAGFNAFKLYLLSSEYKRKSWLPLRMAPQLADTLSAFYEMTLRWGTSNNTSLDGFDQLETSLQDFWKEVRSVLYESLLVTNPKHEIPVGFFSSVATGLDPQHEDHVRLQREKILSRLHSKTPFISPMAEPAQTQWGDGIGTASVRTLTGDGKLKPKTRPEKIETANVDDSKEASNPMAEDAGPASRILLTTRRALETMMKVFPQKSEEGAKHVDWNDFVAAMTDIGFVVRHCGGSAVSFEMSPLSNQDQSSRTIVFHKPHPTPKIHPIMLHAFGRRLHRRFGWARDDFVLEDQVVSV
ncbi:MAG: hypothetical protein M1818_003864 [Claussenomyces sp. TS43310]|nr:MAG: hypothetical protein M1818_003864 [Claussenomyces sp. TS43310]